MGKKNKGKKRSRTQRLYEAARKAQKLEGNNENEEEATPSYQNNGRIGEKLEMKEDFDFHDRDSQASETDTSTNSVSDLDLQQTIRTLKILTATPQSIEMVRHSKKFKEFRRVLHPLVVQQLKTYDKGIDYRHRTTVHLAQQEYDAALTSLQACADLEQIPKQGTIQRWVREVDSCQRGNLKISLLSRILTMGNIDNNTNNQHSARNPKNSQTIHSSQDLEDDYEGLNKHDPQFAFMQAQQDRNNEQMNQREEPVMGDTNASGVTILDSWKIPDASISSDPNAATEGRADSTNEEQEPLNLKSLILYREKAEQRTPPNHFDLHLHYIIPKDDMDCILPQSNNEARTKIPPSVCVVPFLPGARVLQNVFTDQECSKLIQIATTMGYRPDHPQALAEPTGIDSCEWLIPDTLQNLLFQRVKNLLPSTSHDLQSRLREESNAKVEVANDSRGGNPCFELNSINKRWRFFRYGQGCVYRPHIDGSWPESKLVPLSKEEEENGDRKGATNDSAGEHFRQQYKYGTDASGETKSFLTFLIYLNDGFNGGATRFFRSSNEGGDASLSHGGMVAHGVQPKQGCVLVFPQGNTASLLHEGSAVTSGTKYVVRTDVLYRRKADTKKSTAINL